MKLKKTMKFQISDLKKTVFIYYAILIVSYLAITIILNAVIGAKRTALSGMELATILFLFICGLNSFSFNFNILLQNGVSRKTMFIVSVGVVALIKFILPILDAYVTSGVIGKALKNVWELMLGVNGGIQRPYVSFISCLVLSAVFSLFSFLLLRKAVIKSK